MIRSIEIQFRIRPNPSWSKNVQCLLQIRVMKVHCLMAKDSVAAMTYRFNMNMQV